MNLTGKHLACGFAVFAAFLLLDAWLSLLCRLPMLGKNGSDLPDIGKSDGARGGEGGSALPIFGNSQGILPSIGNSREARGEW